MAKRWLQSVDVELDAAGHPIFSLRAPAGADVAALTGTPAKTLADLAALLAGARRQAGLAAVIAVGNTSGGYAVACTTDQACLYAIVSAPTPMDTGGVNAGEVKVAAVASGTLSHANGLIQGRSLMEANYEGIVVPCSNTNQLRFVSATALTRVKVAAVIAA